MGVSIYLGTKSELQEIDEIRRKEGVGLVEFNREGAPLWPAGPSF